MSLRFYYGVMNSGKTLMAIQTAYNFTDIGKIVSSFSIQDRAGSGIVSSRMGNSLQTIEVTPDTNFVDFAQNTRAEVFIVDEAQFLTKEQVYELAICAEYYKIEVYCFGLLTTFKTTLFEGSKRLVELADELIPLQARALCWCGKVAHVNARLIDNEVMEEGEDVLIGDMTGSHVKYKNLCKDHFWIHKTS